MTLIENSYMHILQILFNFFRSIVSKSSLFFQIYFRYFQDPARESLLLVQESTAEDLVTGVMF